MNATDVLLADIHLKTVEVCMVMAEKDILLNSEAARTKSFTAPALLAAFSVFQTPLCLFVQRVASLSFYQPSTLLGILFK